MAGITSGSHVSSWSSPLCTGMFPAGIVLHPLPNDFNGTRKIRLGSGKTIKADAEVTSDSDKLQNEGRAKDLSHWFGLRHRK